MNKNINILVFIFFAMTCITFSLQGQPSPEEKYQVYRDRLRMEFMAGIGPETGFSLPALARDTVTGTILWSDCTIDLGQYIGVLGTEYHILSQEGKETGQTVKELYYALYALNRLDISAEIYFGGEPSLNGFFIRDDVSTDSLNMDSVLSRLNQGLPVPLIDSLRSDLMSSNTRDKEESLDQAILLITGLGLVRKCVPEDVVYSENNTILPFQDFETSLSKEASNQIARIVNYMKEGDSVIVRRDTTDPNLYGIMGENWDFIIKNPVTYENVMRGENAFLLSAGFAGAKYHLTGQDSPTTDTIRETTANEIFQYLENYMIPNQEDFKVINLDAMSNIWPEGLQADTTFTDYNARVLGPRSRQQDYGWIPMLHQMVFGGKNYLMSYLPPDTIFYNDPEAYYEYLLELAPSEGPYNYNDSIYPNFEWSSTSRTIHPERRGETGTAFPGNYNGLDYMLYYNLYRILFEYPVIIEEITPEDFLVFPNPAKDYIMVSYPQPFRLKLTDTYGRLLQEKQCSHAGVYKMSLNSFSSGTYILIIFPEKEKPIAKKIIIL
ncbi:MAG: T9SS type A sorting domain-containing protein [Bacteroidetes bacterium]|nr:T9SS type A sorting domain-containing protein [Bacteroidota bacterium]